MGRLGVPILVELGLANPLEQFGTLGDLGESVRDRLFDREGTSFTHDVDAFLVELADSGSTRNPHLLGMLLCRYATFLHFRDLCNLNTP